MSETLKHKSIVNFKTDSGIVNEVVAISYQFFGEKLHTAPVVLVNHALTGNSNVADEKTGWWKEIVGTNKVIDTNKYTVIAIDIPGNGFNNQEIVNYKDFSARDIARLFLRLVNDLGINEIYSVIGGSIGGGIAWEMAVINPILIKYLIPIASDWKASDWIIGHNFVQESILENSSKPLQDARKLAMLLYRTPASFKQKFNRTKADNKTNFKVETWLNYHGESLEKRFNLTAYKMMNHLLTTVDITKEKEHFTEVVKPFKSTVVQIGIDSDLFFVSGENKQTKIVLDQLGVSNEYHEIKSIHGHDAFLIEHEQLTEILKPIFD